MSEHRFDGRVAIVTGAGRGIGRAYARLLAERGARVVVNDLGGSIEGVGADAAPAAEAVAEIVDAGGEAIADASDVATEAGAQALVAAAMERFGRLDVLVNNAGIMRWARFPDVGPDDLASHLAVKAGVIGLTRSLTLAGARRGIKVNLIAPAAVTRMAGRAAAEMAARMSPDLVAPLVAYLAHEDCPVSGEIYAAGAGRFARIFVAATDGYVHDTPEPTIEDVARHWPAINDETSYHVPADLTSWSTDFLAHLL
jgi:NAD(P)-dependent dehydrogenase (short-subunit alcohol dehydrogenase family)